MPPTTTRRLPHLILLLALVLTLVGVGVLNAAAKPGGVAVEYAVEPIVAPAFYGPA